MDKFIAERNVVHYRKLLATNIDATMRTTVEMLLATEDEKLARTKFEHEATIFPNGGGR